MPLDYMLVHYQVWQHKVLRFQSTILDWRLLPVQYKDDVFEKSIKAKFQFQDDCVSKGWTLKSIGKKWKDFKCRLLVENYDPSLSRNELIMECPLGIQQDQWESFANYRLSQQAKENDLGHEVSRTDVWLETHKKHDGTYLNDEVRNVSEHIMKEMSQTSSLQPQTLSQDDALGRVLGKEHPGRVCDLGFGPTPSSVFGSTRANVMQQSSNDMKEYVTSLEKQLAATKSQVQAQNIQLEAQNIQLEDMKKNFGGALAAVLQNAFGKVPEGFATWLNQTNAMAPDDQESGH